MVRRALHRQPEGSAVQVDPIKPALKAPGTTRLKLAYDKLLSKFDFKFNLRRYTKVPLPQDVTLIEGNKFLAYDTV